MPIALSFQDTIALVHLGDDENRFSPEFLDDFDAQLDDAISLGAHALVTVATGKFYSNGLDLDWLAAHGDQTQWYVGRVQALISPVLRGPDFPNYQFLAFWAIHLLVVWAAIYLTWGRGFRPTWRDYRFVVCITLAWAAITLTFNSIAGSNYGFLNRKPTTASLLDLFGPWPAYVFVAALLIAAVWALMTWPWRRMAGRIPS